MAEMMKKGLDVKDCNITSTAVEDTVFVNIPEDEIKLENSGIQGKLDSFTIFKQRIQNSVTAGFYPITQVLPGNHPSLQPRAPFWGAWITELA